MAFAPREERLARAQSERFDLLVIGGGITGAAVARDAAARGLSVALLEREDWAAGTSWRSTKLVHGGLRYLETGQFGLVFESLRERAILTAAAPHLVRPAEFLFPEYSDRGRPPWQVALGLTAYDLLALGRAPSRHRRLSREDVVRRESLLESPALVSGAVYPDGRTDDARLTFENVLDAASLGAVAVTRIEVVGLLRGAREIEGAVARDLETGRALSVRARMVVNAAGPWGDRIRRFEDPDAGNILRLSRGTHLTVPFGRLPISRIVAFPLADGRLLFAVPDGAVTMLGTTDTDFSGSPDEVSADKADLEYLLAAARLTFPRAAIGEKDVVSTFAGLRPLVFKAGRSLEETSREEAIVVSEAGLLTITGGKLTTHRRMGEMAVDRAKPLLSSRGVAVGVSATRERPLPGRPSRAIDEWERELLENRQSRAPEMSEKTISHLARRYGSRAVGVMALAAADRSLARAIVDGLPDIDAEIVFAARDEDARSVSDVLIRRTHLFWQASDQGLASAERVGALLGKALAWSSAEIRASVATYEKAVAHSRAWRGVTRGTG
ncbi:MAG TPA: glycerol-3-phosphate dehydrogenase/oxidase [Thermoanaerobaculia bacterium]